MAHIRAFQSKDTEQLRFISKETAWDSYKADPEKLECVPIIYHDYFIEHEPQYAFVLADENDVAMGYIVGSADYEKFCREMTTTYTERVRQNRPEEVCLITGFLNGIKAVEDKPVHYHINLLPKAQRQGWGRKLIDTLCARLQADGYTSLTGVCIHRGSAGYKMYMKCGFVEIHDYGNDLVSINRTFGN